MTESGAAGLGGVADGRGGTGWMDVAVNSKEWPTTRRRLRVRNGPIHGLHPFAHSNQARKHEFRCNATVFWLYILNFFFLLWQICCVMFRFSF